MAKIDMNNLDFSYKETPFRYVSNFKDGQWDEGGLTDEANIVLNECAGVFQYAQTIYEGWSYCVFPPRFKCTAFA